MSAGEAGTVITLTANPGLDLTYAVDEVDGPDRDLKRARESTLEASGKGVNISRALTAAGVSTVAVLPVGASTGRCLTDLLGAEGVDHRSIVQAAPTRINTSVLRSGESSIKVNGPGGHLTEREQQQLLDLVDQTVTERIDAGAVWLAVCGSLPPGAAPSLVGEVVRLARRRGVRCVADVSGEGLRVALEEGAHLVAPNRAELNEIAPTVRDASSPDEFAWAVRTLAAEHDTQILVSLGPDGAMHTDGRHTLRASAPPLSAVNATGAGDALLAGWLAESGPPEERLARAMRWARSACLAATTVDLTPGRRDDAEITVVALDSPQPEENS